MEIPFGHVKAGKLYRSAFGEIKELELAEVTAETESEKVKKFSDAFFKLEQKLKSIEEKIDSSGNKASFLSGLQNLKSSIFDHPGLGDYQGLLDRIDRYEALLEDYINKNRQKNTEIKRALLIELDAILGNVDIEEAFEQIKDLKQRWLKTGSAEKEHSGDIENKYEEGISQFFEKRKSHLEAKNLLKSARTKDYQNIIDQISGFLKKKEFGKTFEKVKKLQQEWKETGRISETEFKKLNDQYWKVTQEYFEESKKFQAERKKHRNKGEKESVEQREAILRQLDELSNVVIENRQKDFDTLRKSWREAGNVSKKKFSEFQERFIELADEIREQQFLFSMTQKKVREFGKKNESEKLNSLIQTLRNFLRRDQDELKSFSENMDKMHINKGSFVDMLEKKLKDQEIKVAIKKKILQRYKTALEGLKSQ